MDSTLFARIIEAINPYQLECAIKVLLKEMEKDKNKLLALLLSYWDEDKIAKRLLRDHHKDILKSLSISEVADALADAATLPDQHYGQSTTSFQWLAEELSKVEDPEVQVKFVSRIPDLINYIPCPKISVEAFRAAFTSNPNLIFNGKNYNREYNDWTQWPHWNTELKDLATAKGFNLDHVPKSLWGYDDCLRCAGYYSRVPGQFETRELLLKGCIANSSWQQNLPSGIADETFQMEVGTAQEFRIWPYFPKTSHAVLEKCLEVNPEMIRYISRVDQTSRMLDIVIPKLSTDFLISRKEYINLGRISKDVAIYLHGLSGYEDVVARKMKG